MTKAMHTEGPWGVVQPGDDDNNTPYIEVTDPYGRTATVYGEVSDAETQANARLIAAAPDLLSVLEEAFAVLGEQELKDVFGYEWHGKASAALAKVA